MLGLKLIHVSEKGPGSNILALEQSPVFLSANEVLMKDVCKSTRISPIQT